MAPVRAHRRPDRLRGGRLRAGGRRPGAQPAARHADAAPVRRRSCRLVRLAAAPARSGAPGRPGASRSGCAGSPRRIPRPAARRWWPSRAGPATPRPAARSSTRASTAPLLRERDLLLVDNRGTGTSGLIDCRRLQEYTGVTSERGVPEGRRRLRRADRPPLPAGRARRRPVRDRPMRRPTSRP